MEFDGAKAQRAFAKSEPPYGGESQRDARIAHNLLSSIQEKTGFLPVFSCIQIKAMRTPDTGMEFDEIFSTPVHVLDKPPFRLFHFFFKRFRVF